MSPMGRFFAGVGVLCLGLGALAGAARVGGGKSDVNFACPYTTNWRSCSRPSSPIVQVVEAKNVQPICVAKEMLLQVAATVETADTAAFRFLTGGGGCGVLRPGTAVRVIATDSIYSRVSLVVGADTLTGWVISAFMRPTY